MGQVRGVVARAPAEPNVYSKGCDCDRAPAERNVSARAREASFRFGPLEPGRIFVVAAYL
jgi:hypothetical protein